MKEKDIKEKVLDKMTDKNLKELKELVGKKLDAFFNAIKIEDGKLTVDEKVEDLFEANLDKKQYPELWKALKGEEGDLKAPYNITVLYDGEYVGDKIADEYKAGKIRIYSNGRLEFSKIK